MRRCVDARAKSAGRELSFLALDAAEPADAEGVLQQPAKTDGDRDRAGQRAQKETVGSWFGGGNGVHAAIIGTKPMGDCRPSTAGGDQVVTVLSGPSAHRVSASPPDGAASGHFAHARC
jgi:hypothetical protein